MHHTLAALRLITMPMTLQAHPDSELLRADTGTVQDVLQPSAPLHLFSTAELRAIEDRAISQLPERTLMLRAAKAVADVAAGMVAGPIVVLAGPGNNGGDAMEAALLLHQRWRDVRVLTVAQPSSRDGQVAFERCQEAGVRVDKLQDPANQLRGAHLVVDGMFGIGLVRRLDGPAREAAAWLRHQHTQVLAIDVPSGLNADTGKIVQAPESGAAQAMAIRADTTLTMIGAKPGLFTADGSDLTGRILLADLGIDTAPDRKQPMPALGWLNHPQRFAPLLGPRARNTHKGSFGNVCVVGGNTGMLGAALLAGRCALHAGAGRVCVYVLGPHPGVDLMQPELMIRSGEHLASQGWTHQHVVVAGPGMGVDEHAYHALTTVLKTAKRLILDADALNLLATNTDLQRRLADRIDAGPTELECMMTPHPLEAARLLGWSADAINADRVAAARALCDRFGSDVVLKGSGSVIAERNGNWSINPTGNPGLASGGTGDVLAGLSAALWAAMPSALDDSRNTAASQVLPAAAWLHGQAADDLVAQGSGPKGLTASELIPAIRSCLNRREKPVFN
jgi:hydroxyethylthiazole kinase-like uncharacterized protein yjeF